MALGYFLYPFANSVWQLYLFRTVFAIGAATIPVMLSTCVVEYIQEVSRGKWVGTSSIFNGLGVLFMSLVLAKTPQWYQDMGADAETAGQFAFWTASVLCCISAVLVYTGLKNVSSGDKVHEHENIFASVGEGLLEGVRNRKLALAYSAAFIGRGDLVVVGIFFSLWITQVGVANGLTPGESLGRAGMLFGFIQLCAMAWAFFIGMISDKINRILALSLGLGIAALGYGGMGQVQDPFSSEILPWCVILGMGETSVIITAGALLGQEMPMSRRAAVVGTYSLIGGAGILAATSVGGRVFDAIAQTAPFTMMGIVNIMLMIVAFLMWYLDPRRSFAPVMPGDKGVQSSDSAP